MAIISSVENPDERAKEVYDKFIEDTGKVPEWVKVMAHDSKIAKEFTELFKVIMKEGQIDPLLRWKIAHVVSDTLRCPFCVDVTTKMLESMGASEQVIENIKKGEGLDQEEKEVLALVKEVTKKATCDHDLFEKLKEKFSEKELVEIVSIIGLFNYIKRCNKTFCVLPE